ncbi:unnamed protein product [Lathyrus oleraceus]
MSSNSSVASNSIDSFNENDSVDSKITLPKNVADVVMEHNIQLDEGLRLDCRYCDDYLATCGGYHFLSHLAGTENYVKACEGIPKEVKKEVLDIFSAFRESNAKGCVRVGEKRKCNQMTVESSRDVSKRRRTSSRAIASSVSSNRDTARCSKK